ncbi:MAG: phosphoenolpyruvate carboxykinase (GTP), partial [Victivallales bacterium]|nr:phosphoenolpyruvate carboxykinase (GTP) [Victivallales bacterium]
EDQKALFGVDKEGWKAVIPQIEQHFAKFGAKLPAELSKQLDELKARLG